MEMDGRGEADAVVQGGRVRDVTAGRHLGGIVEDVVEVEGWLGHAAGKLVGLGDVEATRRLVLMKHREVGRHAMDARCP